MDRKISETYAVVALKLTKAYNLFCWFLLPERKRQFLKYFSDLYFILTVCRGKNILIIYELHCEKKNTKIIAKVSSALKVKQFLQNAVKTSR